MAVLTVALSAVTLGISSGAGSARRAIAEQAAAAPVAQRAAQNAGAALGRTALAFEPNWGQAPAWVRYLAHGAGYILMLGDHGMAFQLSQPVRSEGAASSCCMPRRAMGARSSTGFHAPGRVLHASIRIAFVGRPAAHPRLAVQGRLPGIVNYLIGNNPTHWHTRIPTYARVTYLNVYPHIDLTFYGTGNRPEYDWIVHPGGDPRRIAMTFSGARSVRLDRSGNLLLGTPLGTLEQHAPRVYQPESAGRPLAGGFQLGHDGQISFRLGAYDTRRTVVIDPTIAYSTFYGGPADFLVPEGIAVDSGGNAYVTGTVEGTIPITNPTFQPTQSGPEDAFVAKLDKTGSFFYYSTYLGGSGYEIGHAIAVDNQGYAYVCGGTTSTDFPLLPNGQIGPNGAAAFVVRLRPAGYSLAYAYAVTDSRGAHRDGVVADDVGRATFVATFALPSTQAATSFATVTQLDAAGKYIRSFNTLSKGAIDTGPTAATGIAMGPQGDIAITGYTSDTQLPVKNPIQVNPAGGSDAFVFLLDSQLNVEWGTFWGGNLDDQAVGVGIDANDNVYIAGFTKSQNFPTVNALQSTLAGFADAFAAEFSSSGRSVAYSTYFGGKETAGEAVNGMAVDSYGDLYLAGFTDARDFPVVAANQVVPGPRQTDAFVSEIGFGGKPLVFSTFFGGSGDDVGFAVAADVTGDVYVTGTTTSMDLPTTAGAAQPLLQGGYGDFITKLVPSSPAPPTATPTSTPTKVPPPATPHIFLKSSQIQSGSKLKLTVVTSPNADVTVTLTVKHGKSVVFKATARGAADSSGRWRGSIKVAFNPDTRAVATITARARTAGGTAASSTTVTILHHG